MIHRPVITGTRRPELEPMHKEHRERRQMKLTDLEPRWIHPNMFVFKCPCCQRVFLTCKNVEMTRQETWDILKAGLGEDWNQIVVPPKPEMAWAITGTRPYDPLAAFPNNITVTPSIDASDSGHWHGFITNGECT